MNKNINYQEFVYSLLSTLTEEKNDSTNIALRFGNIINISENKFLDLKAMHPVLITDLNKDLKFRSGVNNEDHKTIQKFYNKIEHSETKEKMKFDGENVYIYVDNKIVEARSKTRTKMYYIYCPLWKYDIRITFFNQENIKDFDKRIVSIFESLNEKIRYKFENYVIDFTVVTARREKSYEIEMEGINAKIDYEDFIVKAFKMLPKTDSKSEDKTSNANKK